MSEDPYACDVVMNQPPAYAGRNLYASDPLLRRAALSVEAPDGETSFARAGQIWGSREMHDFARLANTHPPVLQTHDAQGHRRDEVEFHPAYHALMRRSFEAGHASLPWETDEETLGHRNVWRAVSFFMAAQVECGHLCPVTMTNASFAALKHKSELFEPLVERVRSRTYDHRFIPWQDKRGITIGMGMTEKQGGTDVRANVTVASQSADDDAFIINGHKWFMSAPMCDAFLVLAQSDGGLSCFLVPRFTPDGAKNGLHFLRLKDKLGNRSNASGEVELRDAKGWLIGEVGSGIKTIIEMVNFTRLDCATASAGLMRAGVAQAVHHARHRQVFGKALIEQPLMERVLADLSLDVAAATALSMRLADAFDRQDTDPGEAAYARLMTPVIKYWVCKIAPSLLFEAMECLGGNGYVEQSDLPRLYREAPVNAIWEGSGNVMCLDVLRVLASEPQSIDLVLERMAGELGSTGPVSVDVLKAAAQACLHDQGSARILTEQLAMTAAGAAIRRYAEGAVADAFVDSRLAGQWRSTYGMLDARFDARGLISSLYPQI